MELLPIVLIIVWQYFLLGLLAGLQFIPINVLKWWKNSQKVICLNNDELYTRIQSIPTLGAHK